MSIDYNKAELAIKNLLEALGENPNRPGIRDTPKRVAKMYGELLDSKDVDYNQFFNESEGNDLVVVKDIEFTSLCEHHMLPFSGTVSIGYYPKDKVLGLSKFARVVDKHSKKLQLQEQMMNDIVRELIEKLNIADVAIMVKAEHSCMQIRGAKSKSSSTVTTSYYGEFKQPENKSEFLSIVKGDF